jgi:hypothetical protein
LAFVFIIIFLILIFFGVPGDPDGGDARRSGGDDLHGGDGDAHMPTAA